MNKKIYSTTRINEVVIVDEKFLLRDFARKIIKEVVNSLTDENGFVDEQILMKRISERFKIQIENTHPNSPNEVKLQVKT